MLVTFLQTADPVEYREMLEVTSRTFVAYCARNRCDYQFHLGVIRGVKPWHAVMNRVPLLEAFIARGYGGWVVYADADAYVADLDFDIRGYLEGKQDFFMAASASGVPDAPWWDINNGGFALNCAHPLAATVLAAWRAKLDAPSMEELAAEVAWGVVIEDQHALHLTLQETPGAEAGLFQDGGRTLNWEAQFIRQVVRDPAKHTRASRVAALRARTASVLGEDWAPPDVSAEVQAKEGLREEFIDAMYRSLLGRNADPGGRAYALGVLNRGERTMEQELRAALSSDEARSYLLQMLKGSPAEG